MSDKREAVIISAVRTPVGKFQGALKDFSATDLGAMVVRESVRRAGVQPEEVDEVIMGCVIQAGLGQNPARQAALKGGIPFGVSAVTINKVCGSGLKSVMMAAQGIQLGDTEMVVAGGMESMTNAPYLVPQARSAYRLGNGVLVDAMIHDGLWCAFENYHMGNTGEVVAERYHVSREEQDEYALNSHRKAAAAMKAGKFKDEILPVEIPQKKGAPVILEHDEPVREDSSLDALAKLKPAFKNDGTVTAGNASGLNDGAAALVVASAERARRLGLSPIARIVSYASAAVDPKVMGIGPVPAVRKALEKASLGADAIDLFELNEAFAAQSLAVLRELALDAGKVNVLGGAIALGHPIGASGARILVTLVRALRARQRRYGVAALCIGGGQGVALVAERL